MVEKRWVRGQQKYCCDAKDVSVKDVERLRVIRSGLGGAFAYPSLLPRLLVKHYSLLTRAASSFITSFR
jgi:hypothetical protein